MPRQARVSVAGGGNTNANPHAATTIAGISQEYDANGNLVSTGDGLTNTWNYRNESFLAKLF